MLVLVGIFPVEEKWLHKITSALQHFSLPFSSFKLASSASAIAFTADYNNLCQCETLDDIKMHLSATEYGPYLQNGAFLPSIITIHNLSLSWFIAINY